MSEILTLVPEKAEPNEYVESVKDLLERAVKFCDEDEGVESIVICMGGRGRFTQLVEPGGNPLQAIGMLRTTEHFIHKAFLGTE